MITEQAMLEIVQNATRNQAKIGNKFLVFPAPGRGPLSSAVRLHRDPAQVSFLRDATRKAVQTYAKNGAQNAVAGRRRAPLIESQSRTVALRAVVHGQSQCFRTSPIH